MRIFVICITFVAAIIVWFMLSPLNREAIFGNNDVITSGTKFGVDIGDRRADAHSRLEDLGLKKIRTETDGRCQGQRFGAGKKVDIYEDESWRNGVICVVLNEERVEAIGWFFMLIYI